MHFLSIYKFDDRDNSYARQYLVQTAMMHSSLICKFTREDSIIYGHQGWWNHRGSYSNCKPRLKETYASFSNVNSCHNIIFLVLVSEAKYTEVQELCLFFLQTSYVSKTLQDKILDASIGDVQIYILICT